MKYRIPIVWETSAAIPPKLIYVSTERNRRCARDFTPFANFSRHHLAEARDGAVAQRFRKCAFCISAPMDDSNATAFEELPPRGKMHDRQPFTIVTCFIYFEIRTFTSPNKDGHLISTAPHGHYRRNDIFPRYNAELKAVTPRNFAQRFAALAYRRRKQQL